MKHFEQYFWPNGRGLVVKTLRGGFLLGVIGAVLQTVSYLCARAPIPVFAWQLKSHFWSKTLGVADVVIFTPMIETAFMIYILIALQWTRWETRRLAFLSALLWAGLHYLTAHSLLRLWTALPFYIFGIALQRFDSIKSNRAFLSVSGMHAVMNAITIAAAFVVNSMGADIGIAAL